MKHTNLFIEQTANGLHTPPCGSSQGKSTSFNLRYSLLMPLMILFLLMVGSSAAWAGWRFQGQEANNGDGSWGNGDNMTQVGSSDVWYYKVSNVSRTIEFKINNGSWDNENQKYYEANTDDQNRGNVPLVCGHDNDSKHRFRYEPSTIFGSDIARDLYVFVKGNAGSPSQSDKVWAIAVRPGSGTITKQYSLRGDLWLDTGGWAGTADLKRNPTFVNMTNDVAAQVSYLIPIPSGSNAMKSRFTLVSAGSEKTADHYEAESSNLTNNSADKKYRVTIPANGGSYPTVKRIVLDYYPTNGYVRAHLEDYIVKRDGWHLYVDDKYMGAMSNSGSFTVESLESGTHTMYIANYSHNSINSSTYDPYSDNGGKIHAQQWFGGLYIDMNPAHSNVIFENKNIYYNSGNDYFGPQTYPIVGTTNARGNFKINGGAKDVTFTFDGGVITINAVDHVESLTGDFYVYGAGSNAQNWVTGWSSTDQGGGKANPANHMTITNNVARKTYYGVKGDNLEFKVSNGTNDVGTWSNYSTSKQSGVSASANDQNIRFSLSNASDVTVCYDGANVWLEVEERQKPNDAWRVTGTFNNWSKDDAQMSDDATNRCKKVTLTNVNKAYDKNGHGWIKFKIFKGTDWGDNIHHDNATIIGLDGTVIGTVSDDNESDDHRILVQVDEASDITFSYYQYAGGANIVTVKRTTPTPAEPDYQPWSGDSYRDWYLTGDFTNPNVFDEWTMNPSGYKFAADGDNHQKVSITLDPNDASIFHDNSGHKLTRFEIIRQGTWDNPRINKPQFHAESSNCELKTDWKDAGSNRMSLELTVKSVIEFDIWRWGTAPGSADRKVTVTITPVPQVTVTYKVNNDIYTQQTIDQGGKATNPGTPADPAGYRFAGWDWDFNTTINENTIINALFVEQVTVTFQANGETFATQTVDKGSTVTNPGTPDAPDGYTFAGWDYDFSSAVNSSITVDALWTAKTLTGISLNHTNLVMVTGQAPVTLTPSYLPSDLIPAQQPTYEWSVAPAGVVEVSNAGVVSVVAEGSATVTCTAQGTDKSANCVVIVKDCNTVPTDIFSYTLGSDPTGDAAGSAVMNGMFDEADNTEPAELTKLQIKFGDNSHITGAYVAYVVDKNTEYVNFAASNTTDNSYWYKTYQTESDANNQIFTLKNAATGNYLALSNNLADNSNGDWIRYFATTTTTINNASKWKQGTSNAYRLYNQSNTNLFLHIYNVAGDTRNDGKVVVGGEQGSQGNNQLKFTFENVNEHASNPAYMHSPVSGYYRFATGASVVATLNRAIKVNDVIRLEVKNPSKAAVSATVTIGSQVENINLAAETTTTEEITVTDANRPTSITIASNNVNFMLKSVAVNREMPNPAKDPNLAWGATPSAAHQVAAGDISDYIATRSGAGLITYTSSNESIATVAADGTVHPIAEGTVTITATLEQDGCYDGDEIHYDITLEDLPKPTITITANDEMPQGSYQTVTVAQDGDGALTFGITSGTGATLTDNGDGTYRLALAGNATDIVLTASTERTEEYAQHSVSKNISVQQCYVDGHVIYEYELTGHDDVADVAATGGTYSQANLASVGTTDNPKTVTKIKLKFSKGNGNRIYAVDDGGNLRVQDEGNVDIAEWLLIPAGETVSNPFGTNASYPVYYVCNAKTGRYIYYGSTTSGSGDWVYTIAQLSSTNYKTNYYKWFIEVNNGETRIFSVQNRTSERKSSFKLNSANQYNSGYGSDVKDDHSLLCVGKMSDTNEYSRIYTNNSEMNVGSANNPDYFYSVTHDAHEYYILNGGTVTVSRASAFKVGDVITLNVFNRGDAASNTIKVANNTIVTNVNGAAALKYTVTAGDGIQGETSFVITPLYEFICLNSISIFRPKDEEEFINPTLTWDANLSEQQMIDMNNSETGMTHAIASIDAPVNAAVVYSVSPAGKANINFSTGALTLTGEAQNKDVLTVTATLPAIGCYNEAHATYEIYVKNLAMPTLSASFSDGLKQGYAATLTVETNSDAEPVLSAATGFTYGDAEQAGNVYTYPIVIGGIAESVSVHVTLAQTLDFLAKEADASSDAIEASNLQDLYNNTPADGTLELQSNYDGQELIVDKAVTINGGGYSIGNLKVENEGDLTLSSALTVADFTICAKAGNTTTPAASGQVRNATNLTVNGEAYFLYTVDPSGHVQYGWYDFTVPFRVNVMTGIAGIENEVLNEDFVNERNYAVMEHLGEKQAAGEYAYKKFRGVMEPCRLYSITLDPQNNYNTIRFQKADGDLVAGNEVTLNTYASTVDGKHANWNGVGNGTLHHADAGVSAEYIQVYQSGNKTFLAVDRGQYSLVIGSAFMVQQAGTMTLNQATHDKLLAPKREASVQPTAIQIASEGQPFSDQLFISADEMAGQVYTQGADVAKAGNIGNVNVPQIWTNAYNSKLCAHEAQLINGEAQYALSLYAPANGSYTLTSKNIPEGYTLYLTQNGNRIWDLSESYVLDLSKGTATEYGLLLVENYKMPTAIENIGSQADETQKIMRNGILYILRNGKVFNAQGAVMK